MFRGSLSGRESQYFACGPLNWAAESLLCFELCASYWLSESANNALIKEVSQNPEGAQSKAKYELGSGMTSFIGNV